MYDCIKNNKIVILDTSYLETGKEIIHDAFLRQWWNAIRLNQITGDNRNPPFLFLDEIQNIVSENSEIINTIINDSQEKAGIISNTQYLHQLNPELKNAVRDSYNSISFNSGNSPSEAGSVAQLYNISANEISSLGRHECISRVMSDTGYKSDIEVNIDTFGVRPPKRNQKEIRSVIESINNKYGSVENIDELRNQDIKRFDN